MAPSNSECQRQVIIKSHQCVRESSDRNPPGGSGLANALEPDFPLVMVFYNLRREPQTRTHQPRELYQLPSLLVLLFKKPSVVHKAKMSVSKMCRKMLSQSSADPEESEVLFTATESSGLSNEYDQEARSDLVDRGLAEVVVGPDEVLFEVDKEMLCNSCRFFWAAFNLGFKETYTMRVYLPEEEPKVFALFLKWLDKQRLGTNFTQVGETVGPVNADELDTVMQFAQLSVFAERMNIPKLRNVALFAVNSFVTAFRYLPTDVVLYMLENTPPSSQIGAFAVEVLDYMLWHRPNRLCDLPSNSFCRVLRKVALWLFPPEKSDSCTGWRHGANALCCSYMSKELQSIIEDQCGCRRILCRDEGCACRGFP